jgi:hypothetical protein
MELRVKVQNRLMMCPHMAEILLIKLQKHQNELLYVFYPVIFTGMHLCKGVCMCV